VDQQRGEERRRITVFQYRLRRSGGWGLVTVGIIVGVGHWLTHIGAWSFASQGVMDLFAGYPLAALLVVAGSIVLSRA
jgi:hypothetical protein